jgi:hypothetical protein
MCVHGVDYVICVCVCVHVCVHKLLILYRKFGRISAKVHCIPKLGGQSYVTSRLSMRLTKNQHHGSIKLSGNSWNMCTFSQKTSLLLSFDHLSYKNIAKAMSLKREKETWKNTVFRKHYVDSF